MKAKRTKILKDESGDVGIGTLIIFIAMVLVAAVAAAVLIQTSGVLQQKAQQTGKEATAEVSSNLKIVSIVGTTTGDANPNKIVGLNISIELSAGGKEIDMRNVKIKYINDTNASTMSEAAAISSTEYGYTEDRSISGGNNGVLQPGDLGLIKINLGLGDGINMALEQRKKAQIQIIPETGTMVVKEFIAPSTLGAVGTGAIQLFP